MSNVWFVASTGESKQDAKMNADVSLSPALSAALSPSIAQIPSSALAHADSDLKSELAKDEKKHAQFVAEHTDDKQKSVDKAGKATATKDGDRDKKEADALLIGAMTHNYDLSRFWTVVGDLCVTAAQREVARVTEKEKRNAKITAGTFPSLSVSSRTFLCPFMPCWACRYIDTVCSFRREYRLVIVVGWWKQGRGRQRKQAWLGS